MCTYKLCIYLFFFFWGFWNVKSVTRLQCSKSVTDANIFFQSEPVSVVRVASLSKFEYKCTHRPRRNNVVNYSSKTRLCQPTIRQFHIHNTCWALQLAAIAVIDRIVSNDRAPDCAVRFVWVVSRVCTHINPLVGESCPCIITAERKTPHWRWEGASNVYRYLPNELSN